MTAHPLPRSRRLPRGVLLLPVLAASLVLGACANLSARERNTAVGATVGGVLGSVLTGGSTVGTVGGAVIGGVIGQRAGESAEPGPRRDARREGRPSRDRDDD